MKPLRILMCASSLKVKGGMVSVVKNYLGYSDWGDIKITFVPTHIETNKYLLIAYFAVAYLRILWLAIWRRIDIAHLHVAERGSFYRKAFVLQTLKRFGVRVILHHHGAEFDLFYNGLSDKRKEYVNRILCTADLNIVLSQRLVQMIKGKSPEANVEVLYNAVNVPQMNPYDIQSRNVLFLGRLGHRKGTYDLLEVIKRIDKELPSDVKFYLCGDGETEAVKKEVEALGISHRISHIGWIDGKQKEDFMKQSMVNVLPSYNEGLPMTILETMAHGIPNISTNIASIPEVLHDGENGFLINPGDVDALCDCLLRLATDEALRKKFSERSYELMRRSFSLDANIAELRNIYQEMGDIKKHHHNEET